MAPPRRRQLLVAGAALAAPALACAQGNKPPIRILVGFPPGGATDAIARAVVDHLPAELGQAVIVDNKPGVGGRIAADLVLAAPADGLTCMISPNATPTFQMLVFGPQLRWHIERDFAAVATLASYPLGMGAALTTGASNAREFIAWAVKNPKEANFGTPGLGGQNHFLGVQFAKATGLDLAVVPYKGTPPMITDLVGGQLASAISLLDGMLPHHRAGKIQVLGVFTKERSPLMPDIPTFAEQGIVVTSGEGWTGTKLVAYELDGAVALIGLNRTDKRNAINAAMIAALRSAVVRAHDEADVTVLFGHGGNFSAGLDLTEALDRATGKSRSIPASLATRCSASTTAKRMSWSKTAPCPMRSTPR